MHVGGKLAEVNKSYSKNVYSLMITLYQGRFQALSVFQIEFVKG